MKTVSTTRWLLDLGAVHLVLEPLELHALELAALDHEALRGVVDDDLDLLLLGVLQLPGRGLEEAARAARHDLDVLAPRRREVRQQSMAVLPTPMISTRSPILSMCPKATDSSQSMPMWIRSASVAAGEAQVLALRRAGADEHGVEAASASSSLMLATGAS